MVLTYRTDDLTKWGTGKGSNLTKVELDINFWTMIQRIVALEDRPIATGGIDYFEISGDQLYVHLVDDTRVLGPYTLPKAIFRSRGAWQPTTAYSALDTFTINGGLYVVNLPHNSAATFDPGANDGLGNDYYILMIQTPGSALPTGGATGQILGKSSGTDFAVTWVWKTPTGGVARQYHIKNSSTQDDSSWSTPQAEDIEFTPTTGSLLVSTDVASVISELEAKLGAKTLAGLSDITFPTGDPQIGALLTFDGLDWTSTVPLSSGQYLKWDGSSFIGETPSFATQLTELTDVVITSPNLNGGDTLIRNSSSQWVNRPPFNNVGTTGSTVSNSGGHSVVRFTPTADLSLQASGTPLGVPVTFIIVTNGTTSYNITAGAGTVMDGTLATGTVSGKVWTVTFIKDFQSTNFYEISRSGPM